MAVAVGGGSDCWRFYNGGILTEDMNCSTSLDHEVTLVGYTETSAGTESQTYCYTEQSTQCRSATRAEIKADACPAGLTARTSKNGKLASCCEVVYTERCSITPGEPVVAHWTIQN